MATVKTNDHTAELDVAYLVVTAPDDFVHDRFARALIAAGGQLQRYGVGLKMPCRGVDWKSILRTAGESLSITERHDVRVATVPSGKGPAALAGAIFGARRLDERLNQLASEWLPDVLKRRALAIHFQPLIQQPPGRIYGYEYFMRGIDEAGAIIPPAKMFEAAGHLGLFAKLDEMCRLAAIARAVELGLTGQLFLNFCPAAIYNPETCLRKTIAAIQSAGMNPDRITFEAPAPNGDIDRTHLIGILRYCQSLGFKVAIKHIRADHTSSRPVGDLRPDYLKLDGALIRRAAHPLNTADAGAVREIVEAARKQDTATIAGGIETEQEMKFAFDAGIRLSQGFYHAPPSGEAISADATKEILRRAKDAYAATKGKPGEESGKPWDFSALYRNLSTIAHAPPRKSA
jgi:EAL domain-containing protein (putative c-di-GMP-specific phosphodiesterase class I)